ncbi:methyltransferase domain-containing protein [Streptomyces sp. NPDC015032]|uniref:methyltransferase domain-containing protein n=1 Tax=Streptomyces sp. NPDC015032 TaxID=3364937 RepID=UPI0036FE4757
MPSLVVRMLRHGRLGDGLSVLDLGTGSGGLTAYVARRIGDQHVTSLELDPHLTRAAGERLAQLGISPTSSLPTRRSTRLGRSTGSRPRSACPLVRD